MAETTAAEWLALESIVPHVPPMDMCWAIPKGWDVTDVVPRCGRPLGHPGKHVCHIVWTDATDMTPAVVDAEMVMLAMTSRFDRPGELRKFIEGFN